MSIPPHPSRAPSATAVGVLDRVVAILDAVETNRVWNLTDVVRSTGLSRSTAHRLLQAMEAHELLGHSNERGYHLGPRFLRLSGLAMQELPLRDVAHPVLERLARTTGETAQLYIRRENERLCLDTAESPSELRTIVPVGAALPLTKGSAAKIFLTWTSDDDRHLLLRETDRAGADRLERQVLTVRRRGWAESVGEREPGVASVSAPILGPLDALIAVVSVSGPTSRLGRARAGRHASAVVAAAREIERALGFLGRGNGPSQ